MSKATFLRLLERLLDTEHYSSDAWRGVWLIAYEQAQGRQALVQ